MNSKLTQIENLVGIIENLVGIMKLRESGYPLMVPPQFRDYDDVALAKALCSLAVTHLDSVSDGAIGDALVIAVTETVDETRCGECGGALIPAAVCSDCFTLHGGYPQSDAADTSQRTVRGGA